MLSTSALLYLTSATCVIALSNNDSFDGTKLFSKERRFHVFDHIKKYQKVYAEDKTLKANRKKKS